MKEKIVNLILKNPKASLALFFIIWLVGVSGLPQLKHLYTPRVWFNSNHPLIKNLDQFEVNFQSDESILIAFYHPKSVLTSEGISIIKKLKEGMYLLPKISKVHSLANTYEISSNEDEINIDHIIPDKNVFNQEDIELIKSKIESDSFNGGSLISPNRLVTTIVGSTNSTRDKTFQNQEVVEAAEKLVASIDPKGGRFYIYGSIKSNDEFRKIAKEDNYIIIPLIIIVVVCLLIYLYRSLPLVILSVGIIVATITFTIGVQGHIGFYNTNLLAAIPGILMAICLADTIHLLEGSFKGVENGVSIHDAIRTSLLKNFLPTILTSFTTFVGFLSLMMTELSPVYSLGCLSGIGALMAWLFTYLVLGASLSIWGEHLIKPRTHLIKNNQGESRFVENFVSFIDKTKLYVCLSFFTIFVLFLWATIQGEVDSDPMTYFSENVVHKQEMKFIRSNYPYKNSLNFVVDSGVSEGIKDPVFMKKLDELLMWISNDPAVSNIDGINKDIKELNQHVESGLEKDKIIPSSRNKLAELLFLYSISLPEGSSISEKVSNDYRRLKLTVFWNITSTTGALLKSEEFTKKATELGISMKPSGSYNLYMRINQLVVDTFIRSLGSALVAIFIILLILYRNFTTSILATIPNLFALITTGFIVWSRGINVDIGAAIVAAICLGISIDDTIHFIARYNFELKKLGSPRLAITETLNQVGSALIITTLILILSFLSFLTAGFSPTQNLGISTAITLLVALLADLVLLPAIFLFFEPDKHR